MKINILQHTATEGHTAYSFYLDCSFAAACELATKIYLLGEDITDVRVYNGPKMAYSAHDDNN